MQPHQIDPKVFELYDTYCHSAMSRRDYLAKAAQLSVVGGSAVLMAESLLPNYAQAQEVQFTDSRIKATYVTYDSPGGNGAETGMRGYLVRPSEGEGPFPVVLVVHENRGLNPYIEDVARRVAAAGMIALAPDALSPIGGYPGNDDDGKVMQRSLDRGKIFIDMMNGAKFLKNHELSNGKLGATGFCFGGGVVNNLAVQMGADLNAGVPYYGRVAKSEDVPMIHAPLMVQFAEDDPRINEGMAGYEAALTEHGKDFMFHVYPGTRHGFHNYSTMRYDEEQAKIAWDRTIAFFQQHLA